MCYAWHEDLGKHEDTEKSVQNDVAQVDRRKTVPERAPENRVRSNFLRLWTVRVGRHERTTGEATPDRILEKV
jgi:hypothetical protein